MSDDKYGSEKNGSIGKPVDRQDARLKVMGGARYSAEFSLPDMAYAVPVQSTIGKGRILGFDLAAAQNAPGVLAVFTHENRPPLNPVAGRAPSGGQTGENQPPLRDANILYNGQNVALVVADTYERARYAATLVKVRYDAEKPVIEIESQRESAGKPEKFFGTEEAQVVRGTPVPAYEGAAQKTEGKYTTPYEHHHPIEPHATVAVWDGDKLTAYDASQGVGGPQYVLAQTFGIPMENVRVVCHFTGGGFGTKGGVWPHTVMAAMAAKAVKRPVKLALMRQQMVTVTGHRGATSQIVQVGAGRDNRLVSLRHDSLTDNNALTDFSEPSGMTTRLLYQTPNLEMVHRVAATNIGVPIFMRAPGESVGTFALESAMDEMAHALKVDPIQFRLINHADINPQTNKPWSSKHLKECYERGAKMIGWDKRKREPGSVRQGRYLIGYGMATATYPGYRNAAGARVRIFADGHAVGSAAGNDIGTGAYTALRQVTSAALGMPLEKVMFELGDTAFPQAPVAGGSWLTASLAPAAMEAAEMALQAVAQIAIADPKSPLYNRKMEEIAFGDGRAFVKDDKKRGEKLQDIVKRTGKPYVEACARAETMMSAKDSQGLKQSQRPPCAIVLPDSEQDSDMDKYAFQSFGAHFCRLRVDEELGVVRLLNWAVAMDVGRIINPKTARNQIMGGIGFGIGMAMSEETPYDPNTGRPVARNLADYHVAANADVPDIEVEFLDIPDPHINRIGARGIGEIGITGVAAAIANGVFNATGKRLRELPLTPDKLV